MTIRQILAVIAGLFSRPRQFWQEMMQPEVTGRNDMFREYAVPVIAVMQLCKFPLIGEPRPAMLFALFSFVLDIAALYLLSGIFSSATSDAGSRSETAAGGRIPVFALTPFWFSEPFFFAGTWGGVAVTAAGLLGMAFTAFGLGVLQEAGAGFSSLKKVWLSGMLVLVIAVCFLLQRAVIDLVILSP